MRRILLRGLCVTLAACVGPPEDLEPVVERESQPIINGQPVGDAPQYRAVVSLHLKYLNTSQFSPQIFCSGTLIAGEWVLTAAHCLDAAEGYGPGVKPRKANTLAVNASDDPSLSFTPQPVSEVHIHPGYDRRRLENDLGLLRLRTASSGATVPNLPAAGDFTQADVDALLNLNFAGFGYSDLGKTQIGVKLQVDLPLGGLGCSVSGCPAGAPTDTQISYVQTPDGPCNGDSGGPAFVDRGGVLYVGGVTSYGDGTCSNYGASTNVAAFAGWIDSYLSPPPPPDCSADGVCNSDCAAGADPDCGSMCLAAGASCTSGGECCSGSCGGKPGRKTCR